MRRFTGFTAASILGVTTNLILFNVFSLNHAVAQAFVGPYPTSQQRLLRACTISESFGFVMETSHPAAGASIFWESPASPIISSAASTTTMIQDVDLSNLLFQVQRVGENLFTAMIFVALAQGSIALIQYRTNPKGQLIIPPGLTIGIAEPNNTDDDKHRQPHDTIMEQEKPISALLELASNRISTETSQYARLLNRLNRWLVILIPVASQKLGWIMQRNTHLFHLGFIMTLAGLFEIPNRWLTKWDDQEQYKNKSETLSSSRSEPMPKPPERIIVIGDSLAVGLGSVNVFDATKTNADPFCRIENVNLSTTDFDAPGPVFPRTLAETLATLCQTTVSWRSAGVDGGDVSLIRKFCLDLIKEEVGLGRNPDVVFVLCGTNDLKYFLSNPFVAPGPRSFSQRLNRFLRDILRAAPNTKIVLPMIPTQMFHTNSPLNIFPLNLLLDTMVGFWDSQKKLAANQYPSENVIYLGLQQSDLYDWYKNVEDDEDRETLVRNQVLVSPTFGEDGLIAADGIHPNAKCYGLWAKSLGKQLVETYWGGLMHT